MRIILPCTEALPYLANYHSKFSPARFLQEELDVTFMERCCDIMDTGTEPPRWERTDSLSAAAVI